MSPVAVGTLAESGEGTTSAAGGNGAVACLAGFSEGLCFNLTESLLDGRIADNTSSKSEEDESLFHF